MQMNYFPYLQVMLYPMQKAGTDFLVVMDSQRKESHLLSLEQVLIPQFPECRDMVWVCGEKQLQDTGQVR